MLSSTASDRLTKLDKLAADKGLKFQMMNEMAYMQDYAFVKPVFEMVELEQDDDFTKAVENIHTDAGLEQ